VAPAKVPAACSQRPEWVIAHAIKTMIAGRFHFLQAACQQRAHCAAQFRCGCHRYQAIALRPLAGCHPATVKPLPRERGASVMGKFQAFGHSASINTFREKPPQFGPSTITDRVPNVD